MLKIRSFFISLHSSELQVISTHCHKYVKKDLIPRLTHFSSPCSICCPTTYSCFPPSPSMIPLRLHIFYRSKDWFIKGRKINFSFISKRTNILTLWLFCIFGPDRNIKFQVFKIRQYLIGSLVKPKRFSPVFLLEIRVSRIHL